MNSKSRLIIFIASVIAFLIITPLVVLFSQGYRFDLKERKFVQTGAIYLKTKPQEINLRLGDKTRHYPKAALLYSGILIKNLLPAEYNVLISASSTNFYWEKNMTVEPLLVTKATRVVLPYDKPLINVYPLPATSSLNYLESVDENNILYSNDGQNIYRYSFNQTNAKPELVFSLNNVSLPSGATIQKVQASAHQQNFIVFTQKNYVLKYQDSYFLLPSYLQYLLQNSQAKFSQLKFSWHPADDSLFFVLAPQEAYWVDLNQNTNQQFSSQRVIGLSAAGGTTFFLNLQGELYGLDRSNQQNNQLIGQLELLDSGKSETFYQIYHLNNGEFLLWNKGGGLVLFDEIEKTQLTLAEAADNLELSNDQTRLAFSTANQIYVYFLEKVLDDTRYEQGDKILINKLKPQENIEHIYFANDNWYLITPTNTKIIINEIDTRPLLNHWEIPFASALKPLNFNTRTSALTWANAEDQILTAQLLP